MLIRFEVENFRSILAPAELSMVAVDDRPEVREFPKFGASLVPVAGVFGPNASGKSNVLAALAWLRESEAADRSIVGTVHHVSLRRAAHLRVRASSRSLHNLGTTAAP